MTPPRGPVSSRSIAYRYPQISSYLPHLAAHTKISEIATVVRVIGKIHGLQRLPLIHPTLCRVNQDDCRPGPVPDKSPSRHVGGQLPRIAFLRQWPANRYS